MEEVEEKKICVGIRDRDRISSLPESLLHRILSFLDTKYVVRTCILSKRWRNVCTSIANLTFSFNFEEYAANLDLDYDSRCKLRRMKTVEFMNFVEKALNSRDGSQIKKFVFSVNDLRLDENFMKSSLCSTARHEVQDIEIEGGGSCSTIIKFPRCLYVSDSLENMKLKRVFVRCPEKSVGFQALKELRLHDLQLRARNIVGEILPKCRVLQVLSLVNCYPEFNCKEVKISAPMLKKLEILYPLDDKLHYSESGYMKPIISAPKLSYFKFEGTLPTSCSLDDKTSSIEEVHIDVQTDMSYHYNKDCVAKLLLDMLQKFCNAKSVTISSETVQILSEVPWLLEKEASPFSNLKNLELKWSAITPAMNFLLKDSPNVKLRYSAPLRG